MKKSMRSALAVTGASALAIGLTACGGSSGGGSGSVKVASDAWILGTTDTVTALDPAGSYDLGSSTLEYNLYQTLVTVPPNSNKIVGDAAQSCTYSDPKTLKCTLKPGLKFSNGDALTSSDVKYSFERAINPHTKRFAEFPAWVAAQSQPGGVLAGKPRVAMFCTGGIRCEKASAFMLQEGFEEVYHLKGGILKYLEQTPQQDSKWRGGCYVFDERTSVDHDTFETR